MSTFELTVRRFFWQKMGIEVNIKAVASIAVLTVILLVGWYHMRSTGYAPKLRSDGIKQRVTKSKMFVRENSVVSDKHILLLHGARFTSNNWQNLGTLSLLSQMGWKAVAVDLPGFGESRSMEKPADASLLLEQMVDELGLTRPVVVSPSMSGVYSVAAIVKLGAKANSKFRGYIPIAPTTTDLFDEKQFSAVQLPTLFVYGEKDTGLGAESANKLKHIPGAQQKVITGAGHACYLDNPNEWHQALADFLPKL